jgi:hypothetical protein
MSALHRLDKPLFILICGLFVWFFLSSLSIAYHRAPQQDDAMFATVVKNFLRGEGWATNYGEKIPFNPDLTAGPALLLPAAPLMALFGNQSWVPAISGALVNISLSLLILYQFYRRARFRPAVFLAFLLSLSLFAVNDFKTFTGYYSSGLLFVLALLLVSNPRYKPSHRLLVLGFFAATGLYTKPLILLSFIAIFPLIFFWYKKEYGVPVYRATFLIALGFFIAIAPWHLYKTNTLEKQGQEFQQAYKEYSRFFFEHHGSGIAHFREAENKFLYIKKNTLKNTKILKRHLKNHLGIPFYLLVFFSALSFFYYFYKFLFQSPQKTFFDASITAAIAANLLWFVCFSFAMTPGHAFFALFFVIFLLFYLIANYSPSNAVAVVICLAISACFLPAHPSLKQAYSFRADDPVMDNLLLQDGIHFINSQNYAEPLASCGYAGAPWRMIYLRQSSDQIIDCYHLLEDGLHRKENGQYQWQSVPDFLLVVEGVGLLGAAKSQAYVLEPLLALCSENVLYRHAYFGLCKINGAELISKLDPAQTASELSRYQGWYRTRLKI